jgi:hypothetical protein
MERFHRTLFEEHLRVQGRTKWYEELEEMQKDPDVHLLNYNTKRPHGPRHEGPYAVLGVQGTPAKKLKEGANPLTGNEVKKTGVEI